MQSTEDGDEIAVEQDRYTRRLRPFTDIELADLRERLRRVEPELIHALRQSRENLGWSQVRLANELEAIGLKLDPTAITRIEIGKRSVRAEELWAFAVALRTDIGALLLVGTEVMDPAEQLDYERRRLAAREESMRVHMEEVEEQRDLVARLERQVEAER